MPVSFLKAAVLGGAALGALPIIIHLLSRRRYRVTVWAAMEFLLEAVRQNARRLMLQDILLMLLRVLIVVLTAVMLARPVLTGSILGVFGGRAEVGALIILDDSYSMGYRSAAGTLFEQAKARALDIIRGLPAGSMAAVVTVNEEAEVRVQPTFELDLAAEVVRGLRPSWRGSNLAAGLEAAPGLLARMAKPRREVFIITDAQRRALPARKDRLDALLEPLRRVAAVYLVRVGGAQWEDVSIDALGLRGGLPTTSEPVEFTVTVTDRGPVPQRQVAVELFVDGLKVDTAEVDLAAAGEGPGRSRAAVLRARIERPGLHQVEARLLEDRLEADDRRYLPLRVYDHLGVLVVDGEPGEGLFEGEADYLAFALSPVDPDTSEVVGPLRSKVIRLFQLPREDLSAYGVVVLANVASVPKPVVDRLERFVRRGGGLMVWLGDRVQPEAYNRDLYRDGEGLLPVRLGGPVGPGQPEGEGTFGFSTTGLTHPILRLFAESASADLSTVRVYRALSASLPEGAAGRVICRYTNGGVAMAERPFGRGRVLLVTTSADAEWTDLPHKAAFLPLLHRSIYYLVRSLQRTWMLAPAEPIVVALPPEDRGGIVEVRRPGSQVDEVSTELTDEGPRVRYPNTGQAGFYLLRRRGLPEPLGLFAVNVDPAEADLSAFGEAQLRSLVGGLGVKVLGGEGPLGEEVRRSRRGRELWRWLLALVLGLALLETFLGRAFAPKES